MRVLDGGEAGADGEAADGGVDQEADAVAPQQEHDRRRLERLLDQRRDVAREQDGRRARGSSSVTLTARLATAAAAPASSIQTTELRRTSL